MKVWKINSGPYHRDEVEDDHLPEDLEYMVVALIEVGGQLYDQEFWFGSWEEVQQWIMHFQSKIEPIVIGDIDDSAS